MNYFSKLIKDARFSFRSRIEGAQLLEDRFDEQYQVWLVDVLRKHFLYEIHRKG